MFTLSDISYAVNSNSLRVFVNGIRYYPPDIQELSSTAVGVVVGLEEGDNVLFEVVS